MTPPLSRLKSIREMAQHTVMAVNVHSTSATEALIQTIADKISAAVDPEEILLFGSQASALANADSDIDILVIVPDQEDMPTARAMLFRKIYDAIRRVDIPIDVLLYSRSEVEAWRGVEGHVINDCLTQGRSLYAHR
jgi:predicted nucleotidyltransferase